MRVLILSELFYPHGSGAELATYLYARLLSRSGFEVVVVTNRFSGEPAVSRNDAFTLYRLPLFKGVVSLKYSTLQRVDLLFSSFFRKIMKWADVVYVPRRWYGAIPVAKIYGKRVVTHLHDYTPVCALTTLYDSMTNDVCKREGLCSTRCIYRFEREKRSLLRSVESTFLNRAVWSFVKRITRYSDVVVCVSEAQRKLVIKCDPSLAFRAKVVYNPLPDVKLAETEGNQFGYFGGPSYMKGFHVLYKAATRIHRVRHEQLRIHATKFSGVSERFMTSLMELGIVVHDRLSIEDYAALYNRIKTVIVPSVWEEPLPYVVTEAMLGGKLLIASRIGGIPEQVADCEGVFLFDAGEDGQLIEKILWVEDLDRETTVDLGMKNREMVLKKFNNDKILADFLSLMTKVDD